MRSESVYVRFAKGVSGEGARIGSAACDVKRVRRGSGGGGGYRQWRKFAQIQSRAGFGRVRAGVGVSCLFTAPIK